MSDDYLEETKLVSDAPDYDRTPWWGWLIMVAAAAMFIGLIVTALKSGGG